MPDFIHSIPVPISEALDQLNSTQGSILFRGASGWECLAPSTLGRVLQTQGASSNPQWIPQDSLSSIIARSKSIDEYASGTSLQDDDDLYFDVGTNQIWVGIMFLSVSAAVLGGFKWAFSLPTGASGTAFNTSGIARTLLTDITIGVGETAILSASTSQPIIIFRIATAATLGTVKFRWAKNASGLGGDTVVGKGSSLFAIKIQ